MFERNISQLPTFEKGSTNVNIVIEASKGLRMKLKFNEEEGIFRAEKVLPIGLVFPFDFGFLPSTKAPDGDPLDVLVLSEAGIPAGTVVLGRVLRILKCDQTEEGKKERNDRIIAIPLDGKSREPMQPLIKFDTRLQDAISRFFVEYNKLQKKSFRILGVGGRQKAIATVRKTMKAAANSKDFRDR
jgi:inorganic pyrophosphatase